MMVMKKIIQTDYRDDLKKLEPFLRWGAEKEENLMRGKTKGHFIQLNKWA